MIIKTMKELGRRVDEQNRVRSYKKNQREMQNTITNKNYTNRMNSKLNYTEEWISELEDRIVEITDAEQKKKR